MILQLLVVGSICLLTAILFWGRFYSSIILLWIKKFKSRRRFDLYDYDAEDEPEKCGIIVPKEESVLESPLSEKQLKKSLDEIFFYGVNSKSESLVVRILRNPNGESEAWIYLKLSDGRLLYLDSKNGHQSSMDGKITAFTCGGLKMYPMCAMRRWRIVYSGMLKEGNHADEKKVFVKFTFIWTASSDVFDTTSDLDIKLTAKAMSEAKWPSFTPPVDKLEDILNSYCQSGVLNGTINIEEESEKEMYLFGERTRYLGVASNLVGCSFKVILGALPQTGLVIHLGRMSVPSVFRNLYSGFVVNPSSKIDVVEDGIFVSKMFENNEQVDVKFKAGNEYKLQAHAVGDRIPLNSDQSFEGNIEMVEITFKVNDYDGHGFMFSGDIFNLHQKSYEETGQKRVPFLQKNIPLTISFTEEDSHLPQLTGGKGSSLGKLTKLSSELKSEFIVPKGIVITTEAYNKFLTREITEEIEKMKNIAYGNIEGNIHEACGKVKATVDSASLPKEITQGIESKLKSVFEGDINQIKFAVRSSATGEDTDQISAAGQMETFLGVQGLKELFNAVKRCWASQFGYIAVEYKRQNGQILNSPMAVVIQEMVECESSGVLFTCDPVTNNPSIIVITSNYGLGESVVSGSEEPDTIILERLSDEEVKLKDTKIGLKQRKIVLADSHSTETNGTVLEDVPKDKQKECCISEANAINLGKLSLKIEKYFKSLRDIEWGIKNDKIFILQSRPITTGESVSDFEILHELDGPLRSEDDFFTTCNVGEVMPNAASPLGMELLSRGITVVFMKEKRKKIARNYHGQSKYYFNGLIPFYNHPFMSAIDILTFGSSDMDAIETKGMMIAVFGRIMNDPELKLKVKQRNFPEPKHKFAIICNLLKCLFLSRIGLEDFKEKIFDYQLPVLTEKSSKEIFRFLLKFCTHVCKPFDRHVDCSGASSVWNIYVFSVLSKAKGVIDNDVYSDFAKLLASSSNVESADVPSAIQTLSYVITKDINNERFKNMSVEEAQKWLETSETEPGIKYREFLKRHGHRCLSELDVYATPWNVDPKPLIKILQGITGSCGEIKTTEEAEFSNILPHLKCPLDFKSRLLMKFLLPNCRNGIRGREICKSILVKSFDNVRKGFRYLGKAMVSEGYLPNAELIFFLTLDEIKDILESRNPRIIARVKHRRKLHSLMDSLKFPEMSKGRPVPCNQQADEEIKYESNLTMTGFPVSQGSVKGYARVAFSLNDAADLKPGEILITRSTDIAWSPYFPILGGVVTELGGLISHGAVVSREYGLPCVVGLHGATQQFVTGDYVLLDGNKGILQRLSLEEAKE